MPVAPVATLMIHLPSSWRHCGQQVLFRQDRHHRRARQAPRLRLRVGGDLRRYQVGVGLRPARGRAEGEPQAAVVEVHGHPPRGRGGHRQLGDLAPAGLGGLGARQRLPRPAGRVPELSPPLPGRPARRGVQRAHRQGGRRGRPVRGAVPQLRHARPVHRAARVQHDAQDLPRPRRVRRRPALPAPGDRARHLRQLSERPDDLAQEAAVRYRPDGQELPQRDHAGQLHLPHPRVRASRATTSATTSTRRRSSPTTRSALSTSSTGSASPGRSGASSRASPTAPTSTSPRTRTTPASTCRSTTRRRAPATGPTSSSPRPASGGR
jgi:hypothetical protein